MVTHCANYSFSCLTVLEVVTMYLQQHVEKISSFGEHRTSRNYGLIFFIVISSIHLANSEEVKFLVQPKNTTVKSGQMFTLECQTTKNVTCMWRRNGQALGISSHERISYLHPIRYDIHTLKINASHLDDGQWDCTCMDYSTSTLLSSSAWITVISNSAGKQSTRTTAEPLFSDY